MYNKTLCFQPQNFPMGKDSRCAHGSNSCRFYKQRSSGESPYHWNYDEQHRDYSHSEANQPRLAYSMLQLHIDTVLPRRRSRFCHCLTTLCACFVSQQLVEVSFTGNLTHRSPSMIIIYCNNRSRLTQKQLAIHLDRVQYRHQT